MGNAALAWNNLIDADGVTITCSNELPATRAHDYLRAGAYEHVLWRWLATGSSTSLLIDFGAQVDLQIIAIMALTGTDPTTRFRLSTADATGLAGDAMDSGSAAGRHDPDYLMCVYRHASVATGRYLLIDISEAGVSSIGAGRLFAGEYDTFTYNFVPNWSRTPIRRSVNEDGAGGQTFIDRKRGYRIIEVTFEWLHEDDRNGFVEDIDNIVVNEGHTDMLWITDVASSNLPRDCIWGYQDGDRPITQPFPINDIYSASYRIRQRL